MDWELSWHTCMLDIHNIVLVLSSVYSLNFIHAHNSSTDYFLLTISVVKYDVICVETLMPSDYQAQILMLVLTLFLLCTV